MDRVPEDGDFLNARDIEMIYAAIKARQKKFPGEPELVSYSLVLGYIGNRFTPVECIEQEWRGFLPDVPKPKKDEEPKCPNGHAINKGYPLKLAWVTDLPKEEDDEVIAQNG